MNNIGTLYQDVSIFLDVQSLKRSNKAGADGQFTSRKWYQHSVQIPQANVGIEKWHWLIATTLRLKRKLIAEQKNQIY